MEEPAPIPESKRLQFSLEALLIGALTASIALGLVILAPGIFLPLFAILVVFGVPGWFFAKQKPFWGFFFAALFVFLLPFFGMISTILIPKFSRRHHIQLDQKMLDALGLALEQYRSDFHAYPPPESFQNSSAALYEYLTLPSKPYISPIRAYPISKQGNETLFVSQSGDSLLYVPIQKADGKRGFVLMLPGPDRLLGGTLSKEDGFVPNNTDANGDWKADHLDNVIQQQTPK